jgi:Leucine-rich repeat (LRR) protein
MIRLFICLILITFIKIECKEINEKVLEDLGYDFFSTYLDLSGQNFDSIDENTFKAFPSFQVIHLEDNKLTRIDSRVFAYSYDLRELWLESNQITSISKDAFSKITQLEKICLNNNPISSIYSDELYDICTNNPKCILSIKENCSKTSKKILIFIS